MPISYCNLFAPRQLAPLSPSRARTAPRCPRPRARGRAVRGDAPQRSQASRRQSEREGGMEEGKTPALCPRWAAKRRWAWGTAAPNLAAAFPTSVSRNRKVPVQLSPIRSCLLLPRPPPSGPSCLWPLRREPLLSVRDGAEPPGAAAEAVGHGDWTLGTIRPGSAPCPESAVRCPAGRAALSLQG